eukprot:jgi/Bigna1/147579/aug1.213_g22287
MTAEICLNDNGAILGRSVTSYEKQLEKSGEMEDVLKGFCPVNHAFEQIFNAEFRAEIGKAPLLSTVQSKKETVQKRSHMDLPPLMM